MPLSMRVELLSDAALASGWGKPGGIDQDVPHDIHGLPLIPGRRLKGLLREATLDLEDWSLVEPGTADEMFGRGDQPGRIRVGNGRIESYEDVKDWLVYLRRHDNGTVELSAGRVIEQYTSLRHQTAISRKTGTAQKDTLRRVRVLRHGLRFEVAVSLAGEQGDLLRPLALACAGVRRLGVSRNRGPGKVRLTLWSDGENLTEAFLRRASEAGP